VEHLKLMFRESHVGIAPSDAFPSLCNPVLIMIEEGIALVSSRPLFRFLDLSEIMSFEARTFHNLRLGFRLLAKIVIRQRDHCDFLLCPSFRRTRSKPFAINRLMSTVLRQADPVETAQTLRFFLGDS